MNQGETITITFHTGTDAFTNSVTGEIEWILNDLARQFVQNGMIDRDVVMDSYGNTVGSVTVEPGEDE